MIIDGYGPFPFEIGDVVRAKDDPGTTAKITSAGYEYIWYEVLTVGADLDASVVSSLGTRTALFEDEWERAT